MTVEPDKRTLEALQKRGLSEDVAQSLSSKGYKVPDLLSLNGHSLVRLGIPEEEAAKFLEVSIDDLYEGGFLDKKKATFRSKFISGKMEGMDFSNSDFIDVATKKTVFDNCNFNYTFWERCYFVDCQFINCTFIGATIANSNFRKSIFTQCNFNYLRLNQTLIDVDQFLKNLPVWTNVKKELLANLRLNAISIGDRKSEKALIREEITASKEHYRKAREAKESYYNQKYGQWKKKPKVYWESLKLWLDWTLWGHGEYPWKLVKNLIIVILMFSIIISFPRIQNSTGTFSDFFSLWLKSVKDSSYIFAGINIPNVSNWIVFLLSIFRFVFLGLFISVLYKSIARR